MRFSEDTRPLKHGPRAKSMLALRQNQAGLTAAVPPQREDGGRRTSQTKETVMHGCLPRTPEFLREGARIDPYSRSFQIEIERMVRPAQVAIIKLACARRGGYRKARWRRSSFGLRAAIRAFVWFWNVPVLGGTDTERR
jgi:hypothetical protein